MLVTKKDILIFCELRNLRILMTDIQYLMRDEMAREWGKYHNKILCDLQWSILGNKMTTVIFINTSLQ
jgi:hypothetical protein